tara:strand:+ start:83 stop:454 length:372 start_codon:yes stop_codon:yes gene_type:complete
MTIKLCLLKSGEDIIADVTEMNVGNEEERNVVGYFLDKPCVVKMRDPNLLNEDGPKKQSGFQVSLFPWIPLSAETRIPIPADWLVTMVEPAYKLKEMYVEDIVNYGNQSNSSDNNSTTSDKSD